MFEFALELPWQMSKIFPKSEKSDPISKQQYNGSFRRSRISRRSLRQRCFSEAAKSQRPLRSLVEWLNDYCWWFRIPANQLIDW